MKGQTEYLNEALAVIADVSHAPCDIFVVPWEAVRSCAGRRAAKYDSDSSLQSQVDAEGGLFAVS